MLVRYVGPSIDVGLSRMANIMKMNGKVVHFSRYRGLKEDDKSKQVHITLGKEFDKITREIFGPYISPDYFPDVNLEDTPLYDMYEDDTTDAEGGLSYEIPVMATGLDLQVPTPEVNDNYVNSSFMSPRGNTYARGKVVR